jgi:hypothetical protein
VEKRAGQGGGRAGQSQASGQSKLSASRTFITEMLQFNSPADKVPKTEKLLRKEKRTGLTFETAPNEDLIIHRAEHPSSIFKRSFDNVGSSAHIESDNSTKYFYALIFIAFTEIIRRCWLLCSFVKWSYDKIHSSPKFFWQSFDNIQHFSHLLLKKS